MHKKSLNMAGAFGMSLAVAICGLMTTGASAERLTGRVKIDGSSTVAPITMAAAEMFNGEQPRVQVTVGISGTGGGFKKFLDAQPGLRTDISDASRPIKSSEMSKAQELGVQYVEIPVGIDGIAVMVHPSNKFCEDLTVDELKRIWEPGSKIKNWKDVREGFPNLEMKLYGPGADSGTFDYFTEVIVGKSKASRSDYTASESDNVLVQGIAGDAGAIGYFGYAYYEANHGKLKLIGVDNGNGPVKPSLDVIRAGKYEPLSRPMFMYINLESYRRPEVKAFLDFFLTNAKKIVEHPTVNYVALSDELYKVAQKRLDKRVTGSAMAAHHGEGDLMKIFAVK